MNRAALLIGLAFGFVLAAARVNDYDVIHNMLLFREPDVFLLMGSAVLTAMPLLWLLQRAGWRTSYGGPIELRRCPVQRSHFIGSAIFGSGWAITGSCPGPALAMVAAGGIFALPVIAGLCAGLVLRDLVVERRFRAHATGVETATQAS